MNNRDVIIACDFPDKETTLDFLNQFTERKPFVKIGMELFYAEGPDIVREIKDRGHKIFLDLKLHDIPNTVEKAMMRLACLVVDMTNVHAAGGRRMMEAARNGLIAGGHGDPVLIAVTQLTSTSKEMMNNELRIQGAIQDTVISYAENARFAGLDGVVCSPMESELIHEKVGREFLTVTPGIRFADSKKDDQTRVTTPTRAAELGSDYIVVGRPITKADDPVEMYKRCLRDFGGIE